MWFKTEPSVFPGWGALFATLSRSSLRVLLPLKLSIISRWVGQELCARIIFIPSDDLVALVKLYNRPGLQASCDLSMVVWLYSSSRSWPSLGSNCHLAPCWHSWCRVFAFCFSWQSRECLILCYMSRQLSNTSSLYIQSKPFIKYNSQIFYPILCVIFSLS